MSRAGGSEITRLLHAAGGGEANAVEQLWSHIYPELRRLARAQLAREGHRCQLQTTVLIHEAYLRLVGEQPVEWANRRHFFAAAAEAMRRIRVDDARKRCRAKRGGGKFPTPLLDDPGVFDAEPDELLALDEALERLQNHDARKAEVVKLRYFAGLTIDETAAALDVAPRTIDAEWRFARAWLHREMADEGQSASA